MRAGAEPGGSSSTHSHSSTSVGSPLPSVLSAPPPPSSLPLSLCHCHFGSLSLSLFLFLLYLVKVSLLPTQTISPPLSGGQARSHIPGPRRRACRIHQGRWDNTNSDPCPRASVDRAHPARGTAWATLPGSSHKAEADLCKPDGHQAPGREAGPWSHRGDAAVGAVSTHAIRRR